MSEVAAKPVVLIVEDDASIRELLRYNLEAVGFEVHQAIDGERALGHIDKKLPAIILLDLMLPEISGYEVCRRIRSNANPRLKTVPILALTALSGERYRSRALDSGADDVMTKPFSTNELTARLKGMLRHKEWANSGSEVLQIADIKMDLAKYIVTRAGEEVFLRFREYQILEYLLRNPGRVMTRDRIIEDLLPGKDIGPRTVDVHISRLRTALNDQGGRIIVTVPESDLGKSSGYMLSAASP